MEGLEGIFYLAMKLRIGFNPIFGFLAKASIFGLFSILPFKISQASPGEYALDFLRIPAGAYQAALGNSGDAGIIGPEALFGNLSLLGNKDGAFGSHQELLLDTRLDAVAVTIKLSEKYTIGIAAKFFDPGNIAGYSTDDSKGVDIKAGDRLFRFGLASNGNLSYGMSLSYYNQRLDNYVGNGFGIDAGVSLLTNLGRFGFSVQNLGPDFKIGSSSNPLPQYYSLGAWLPIYKNMIDLDLGLNMSRDLEFGAAIGLEYRFLSGFDLRAGSTKLDPISLGCRISSGRLAFDYSFIPKSIFGDRHIFSLSIIK
jgi:hypothetical protein